MLASRKLLYNGKVRSSVTIVIAALLLALAFGTLLVRQIDGIWPPRTWLAFVSDGSRVEPENRFTLHPQDHVFRDATTLTYEWRITAAARRPDGVLKEVFLINDEFPGPTIEARSGDRVVVHVTNALEDAGLSVHWHGLHMRGSNGMDGAAGVTQAPIEPGNTFIYDFEIGLNQKGTFWYHAHDGVQRADGMYGGLIVHEPRTNDSKAVVDVEHLLLVGDWYHRSAQEALDFYMHPGAFGLETVPDSLLINGAGTFSCADAVPAFPVDCIREQRSKLPMIHLDRRKRNILRVVNVGAYAGFSVSSDNANFTPLKVDGGFHIDGAIARFVGVLHPGERMDLLVHSVRADQPSHGIARSDLTIALDTSAFKYQNPALSAIHHFLVSWYGDSLVDLDAANGVSERFDIQTAKSLPDEKPHLPPKADHTIVLYAITQKLAHLDNEPRGFINHTTWSQQASPLISMPREQWDNNQFAPLIEFKDDSPIWVDIVLNNLDEDSHPFHLHGHSFWVLSKYTSTNNWGSYNPFEDAVPPGGAYDLPRALQKDTVYVPRRGYAVTRFRADNEGLWMFHCHVLWHQASGMAIVLQVGQ